MRTLAAALIVLTTIAASADDRLPPGHPPVTTPPALPPGHPPLPGPPTSRPVDPDLAETSGIIAAYYASISGPAGTPRDWGRFESLFRPDARLVTVTPGGGVLELTPAQFAAQNRAYFERGGYGFVQIDGRIFEQPILVGDAGAKGVKIDDKVKV